ncbi:hypothetical protein QTV49_003919 [Vibrio vulnificus]|nr:hypothetical protein [Vibrio vulnificus]
MYNYFININHGDTMSSKREFYVPLNQVSNVLHEAGKLEKKALKLKVPVPKIVETDEVSILKTPYIDDRFGRKEIFYMKEPYVKFIIEGEAPKINGFSLVAKIEHGFKDGKHLNTVYPEYFGVYPEDVVSKISEGVVNCPPNCQHCETNRNRNTTFLLHSEEPNQKGHHILQVGSTCVDDFLGDSSLESILYTSKLIDISAGFDPDKITPLSVVRQNGRPSAGYYDAMKFMVVAAMIVDKNGFEPKGITYNKVLGSIYGDPFSDEYFKDRVSASELEKLKESALKGGVGIFPVNTLSGNQFILETLSDGSNKLRSVLDRDPKDKDSYIQYPRISDLEIIKVGDVYEIMQRDSITHQAHIEMNNPDSKYLKVVSNFVENVLPELLKKPDTPKEFSFDFKAMVAEQGVMPIGKAGFCGWVFSKLRNEQPKFKREYFGSPDAKVNVTAEVISMEGTSKDISPSPYYSQWVDVTVVHFKTEDGHLIRWDASKHISEVAEKINVGETYNFNGKVSRNFEANGEMVTRIGGMRKFTLVNTSQSTPTKKMSQPKP